MINWIKHKWYSHVPKEFDEIASYTFWGLVTSVINIGLFQILYLMGTDYRVANIVALTITIICAYVVNKMFVFKTRCFNNKELIMEIFRFATSRGFTMLVDYFGLVILIKIIGISPGHGKIAVTIIVVILNYLLGKFHVYSNGKDR